MKNALRTILYIKLAWIMPKCCKVFFKLLLCLSLIVCLSDLVFLLSVAIFVDVVVSCSIFGSFLVALVFFVAITSTVLFLFLLISVTNKTDIILVCISLFYDKHFTRAIITRRGCPRGVIVKEMDCRIVVSESKLQSCY